MAMSRLLAVTGVLCAGVCAAWPFRQPQQRPAAPPAAAPLELTLRREDVVLLASPHAEVSPAVNLEAIASAQVNRPQPEKPAAIKRTFELTNLTPPPPLPIAFQPSSASEPSPAGQWRPISRELPVAAVPRPPDKRQQPRPYRLRDGDTLENVAERFLGSAARAAEIFDANRGVLPQPDLLPVGTTIIIPPKLAADELTPVGPER